MIEDGDSKRTVTEESLLDLVLTNEEGMIDSIEHQSPLAKSDHQVLVWNLSCYSEPAGQAKPSVQWHKANFNAMREALLSHQWSFMDKDHETTPVEEIWEEIKSKLIELKEQHVPVKARGERFTWEDKGVFPASPKLIALIKKKNEAHRIWIRDLKWCNAADSRNQFAKLRNQVTWLSRQEKRQYEKEIALATSKEHA